MAENPRSDVYEVAVLAGGPSRAVDAALVVLLETGRLRVQRTGEMTVVDPAPGHPVEEAVLDAVAGASLPLDGPVRYLAVRDPRLGAVRDRLRSAGLVRRPLLGPAGATRAGRGALAAARSGPARDSVCAGTSGWWVALDGPGAMPDGELRAAVFTSFDERARRRGWAGDSGWYAGAFGPAGGSDNGHHGGHGGGHSCGGSSSSCSSSGSSCGGGGGCGGGS